MFKKSTGGSAIEWATVVWNKKDDTPTPNFEFYNSETKQNFYLIEPGERATPLIDGFISKIDVQQRAGYNDRKNNTGEKNQWVLRVLMSPDGGAAKNGLNFNLVSDVGVPDYNTLSMLNTLNTMLEEGYQNCPVRLSFYQRKGQNGNLYPASSIVLGSRNEDGQFLQNEDGSFVFDDYKNNMIKSPEMAPRADKREEADGSPMMINGQQAYDHRGPIAWTQETLAKVLSYYETDQNQQQHDDGVDPGQAFDEDHPDDMDDQQIEPPARQRMGG